MILIRCAKFSKTTQEEPIFTVDGVFMKNLASPILYICIYVYVCVCVCVCVYIYIYIYIYITQDYMNYETDVVYLNSNTRVQSLRLGFIMWDLEKEQTSCFQNLKFFSRPKSTL